MPIFSETYREDVVKNIWVVDYSTPMGNIEMDEGGGKRNKNKKRKRERT